MLTFCFSGSSASDAAGGEKPSSTWNESASTAGGAVGTGSVSTCGVKKSNWLPPRAFLRLGALGAFFSVGSSEGSAATGAGVSGADGSGWAAGVSESGLVAGVGTASKAGALLEGSAPASGGALSSWCHFSTGLGLAGLGSGLCSGAGAAASRGGVTSGTVGGTC